MKVESLRDLAAPVDERDGFEAPWPEVTFAQKLARLPLDELVEVAHSAGPALVDRAMATEPLERTLEDYAVLLSPAAGERLE